ncbi:MAG TPA: cytochrome c-type biogenesis CcmF C-terminal domain-containing protein, partial [Bryobacteraceae bacterium]|nr:cytochrome c-type biogenesis CcmF C-terminal domain-containing protein [Bryobacteraceae bacterium]
ASCFAVLWGTLFPVISEAVTGEKISVDAPFFNRINVPIGLGLILLTGVGPLIAWRRSSIESLRRAFFWPSISGLALMAILAAFGMYEHPYALVSFGLCMFVTATIFAEFWKGASAISVKSKVGLIPAAIELTHRNTRRYGGYLVHMGIVFMFIGYTGTAFNQDATKEVTPGGSFQLGHYTFHVTNMEQGENGNYTWQKLLIEGSRGGSSIGIMEPERRFYKASQQPTSEVSIRRRLNEDVYLNFAGVSTDNQRAVVQAYVFPLVTWIWIGYWVLAIGTLVCLVPSKVRLSYARTQVLGMAQKHAKVTN